VRTVATFTGNGDAKLGCMLETPRIRSVLARLWDLDQAGSEKPAAKRTISREVLCSEGIPDLRP